MPVVFRLASWAVNPRPLAEWLVSELTRMDFPLPIARAWVANDRILPLLDGLDEVAAEQRAACIAAIHAFRASRRVALARLAVCCREADYAALPQLRLRGAVLIHPLDPTQVDAYLANKGQQLAGLCAAIRADAVLREIATVPLWLNLMALTYRGVPAESLLTRGTLEERHVDLLNAYVDKMFERRPEVYLAGTAKRQKPRLPYTREQTTHWLAWLARTLPTGSVFYLDQLQPDWLPTRATRWWYVLVDRVSWGLLISLALALPFSLAMLAVRLVFGSAIGENGLILIPTWLAFGLVFGLFGGKGDSRALRWTVTETARRSPQRTRDLAHAGQGLVGGVGVGLIGGLVDGLGTGVIFGLVGGVTLGIPLGLVSMLTGGVGVGPRRVSPVETVSWSWPRATRSILVGLGLGMVIGLVLGLAVMLAVGLSGMLSGTLSGALSGALAGELGVELGGLPGGMLVVGVLVGVLFGVLVYGLIFGLVYGLVFGLAGGLVGGQVQVRTHPNQGIRRSVRRAVLTGVLYALVIGLVFGLIGGLVGGPDDGLIGGLAGGLVFGLAGGLVYGGYACLSHLALRLVLWRCGVMPLGYIRFLDYATERIFLRRVGGGYLFVHRLVQEHFATREADAPAPRRSVAVPSG